MYIAKTKNETEVHTSTKSKTEEKQRRRKTRGSQHRMNCVLGRCHGLSLGPSRSASCGPLNDLPRLWRRRRSRVETMVRNGSCQGRPQGEKRAEKSKGGAGSCELRRHTSERRVRSIKSEASLVRWRHMCAGPCLV